MWKMSIGKPETEAVIYLSIYLFIVKYKTSSIILSQKLGIFILIKMTNY